MSETNSEHQSVASQKLALSETAAVSLVIACQPKVHRGKKLLGTLEHKKNNL